MNTHLYLSDALGDSIPEDEALSLIKSEPDAYDRFQNFAPNDRKTILEFIQGQRGLKITYDPFFKKILSPTYHPKRLEGFLSELLGQQVHIIKVRENEGIRLSENASYIIMDILVELSDGSCVNVEMQKRGLLFPGERSCCYAADFISREYALLNSEKGDEFSYTDLRPYYQIVLMEQSSLNFKKVAPYYIHREQTTYDSGAQVATLWHTMYVSLDTFHKVVQNIDNRLHAWLTFLSSDNPADIINLITLYPEFRDFYQEIAEFRKNPKELIYMYSEALAIMDRNAIQLTLEAELNDTKAELNDAKAELNDTKEQLAEKNKLLVENQKALTDKDNLIADKESIIAKQLADRENLLAELAKYKELYGDNNISK